MSIKAAIFVVLLVLAVLGCSAGSRPSLLGIVADEHLQVIGLEPNSPALEAGVQVGDTLLDLTWFTFSHNIRKNDSKIDKSAIPFTDRKRIQELMDYEYLLKLRVKRGSEVIVLTIQPTAPVWRKYSDPTPTPLWPPNDLF